LNKRKNNSNYDTNSRELLFTSEAVFFFGGGGIFTPQQQKKIQCKVLGVGFWKKCAKVAIFFLMCSWRLPKQSKIINLAG
jgi:hypothetical protein